MQKRKILEECEESKYNVEFANLEIFTSKKGCLLNKKGNFERHQDELYNNNPLH